MTPNKKNVLLQKIKTMKKFLSIIAALTFIFASCNSGDFVGGRYFGTFHNTTNDEREAGNLNFQYVNINNAPVFFMNGLIPLSMTEKNKYSGIVGNLLLNDFLETIPAIDSIHVCDSTETILLMSVDAEFKSSSVKAILHFITSPDSSNVDVEFVGYNE